jgi:hypothetical protein
MKALHLISASLVIAAASFTSAAFAGTDDGNVPGAYVLQTPRVTAPAATTQDTGTAASAKSADDFLRQQSAVSGN